MELEELVRKERKEEKKKGKKKKNILMALLEYGLAIGISLIIYAYFWNSKVNLVIKSQVINA